MPISQVTNEDCMDLMARYPDKYFDLAVVDPPYGGGNILILGLVLANRFTRTIDHLLIILTRYFE